MCFEENTNRFDKRIGNKYCFRNNENIEFQNYASIIIIKVTGFAHTQVLDNLEIRYKATFFRVYRIFSKPKSKTLHATV